MATRTPIIQFVSPGVLQATWTGLLNTDDGLPLDAMGWPDKTVTVYGTFGVGGAVAVEGKARAATNYNSVNDSHGEGNALVLIAESQMARLNENPEHVRPHVIGGDGDTDLTMVITCTRRAS